MQYRPTKKWNRSWKANGSIQQPADTAGEPLFGLGEVSAGFPEKRAARDMRISLQGGVLCARRVANAAQQPVLRMLFAIAEAEINAAARRRAAPGGPPCPRG